MSIRKYIAYLKTIETGSITHAAAQLGYTQSAISRHDRRPGGFLGGQAGSPATARASKSALRD